MLCEAWSSFQIKQKHAIATDDTLPEYV